MTNYKKYSVTYFHLFSVEKKDGQRVRRWRRVHKHYFADKKSALKEIRKWSLYNDDKATLRKEVKKRV